MNLLPNKLKYRKQFKGRTEGVAYVGCSLNFGSFGLKAMEPIRLQAKRIEAARKVISKHVKKTGRLWIRVFPHIPVSKKPAEVRMGKGKGGVEFYVARVRPGNILFEVEGVSKDEAYEALNKATYKLGLKCVIVENKEGGLL